MPPPRSHLLHSFQNSASAFYRFSSAWVKRQRHTGTAYRSSLLSFHQESNNRDDTTTTSEPLPLVAPCSEKTNRGDQLLLSGGLAYFRSAAMYELKYAVGDSEDFDAVVHLEQLLDATASKEGDQEASSVEACEEVLTPILIAALAERLRVAPNMVQDRHLDSGGVTLSSAWLLGSSISDGKDWRRKAEDDEAPAYPSTFLGSEAVGWMVRTLMTCTLLLICLCNVKHRFSRRRSHHWVYSTTRMPWFWVISCCISASCSKLNRSILRPHLLSGLRHRQIWSIEAFKIDDRCAIDSPRMMY